MVKYVKIVFKLMFITIGHFDMDHDGTGYQRPNEWFIFTFPYSRSKKVVYIDIFRKTVEFVGSVHLVFALYMSYNSCIQCISKDCKQYGNPCQVSIIHVINLTLILWILEMFDNVFGLCEIFGNKSVIVLVHF